MSARNPLLSPLALGCANFLILLIFIVVASVAYHRQALLDSKTRESLEKLTERLEGLQKRLDSPLQVIAQSNPRYADQGPPTSAGPGVAAGSGDGTSAAGIRSPVASPERHASVLEVQYKRDTPTAESAQAASDLEATARVHELASSGVSPDALSTQCRARSCRIVALFQNAGNAEDWPIMYVTTAAPLLSQTRIIKLPQPDGSVEVRIYGVRR